MLKNLQELDARYAGKAIAANRNLMLAMYDINIVPSLKAIGCLIVSFFVRFLQIRESLIGKDHAPAERIIGRVPFKDCNFMRSLLLLHQECEIESGWPAANNINLHCISDSACYCLYKARIAAHPLGNKLGA